MTVEIELSAMVTPSIGGAITAVKALKARQEIMAVASGAVRSLDTQDFDAYVAEETKLGAPVGSRAPITASDARFIADVLRKNPYAYHLGRYAPLELDAIRSAYGGTLPDQRITVPWLLVRMFMGGTAATRWFFEWQGREYSSNVHPAMIADLPPVSTDVPATADASMFSGTTMLVGAAAAIGWWLWRR